MAADVPDLRLVLVGLSGVGKSAAGNTILGREEFRSGISSSSLTLQSERGEGGVCGRRVTVVDTPGLFNTELSEGRLREEMERAVSLCPPGPHTFLLVIQPGRFTQQEKRMMEKLQELFGKRVNQYTVVLFTCGDRLEDTTIDGFIREDTNLQQLLQKCGDHYHVFNNKNLGNINQVSNLFEKVEYMVERNTPPFFHMRDHRNSHIMGMFTVLQIILSFAQHFAKPIIVGVLGAAVGAVAWGIPGAARGAVIGGVVGQVWRRGRNGGRLR